MALIRDAAKVFAIINEGAGGLGYHASQVI